MTGNHKRPQGRQENRHRESARDELLDHVSAMIEPAMVALGLVFLILLIMEFASIPLMILGEDRLGTVIQLIFVIFVVDFVVRFIIAPAKGTYLRENWLMALSLALPFLRPFRAIRALRAVRGISLVRLLDGLNRGMRVVRRITRGRRFVYVASFAMIVILAGAAGARNFERGYPDSPIQSFGDALWWSATLTTTMNSELYVVSLEGRVIGFLQRLFALSVFGYITASIASYLIGADAAEGEDLSGNDDPAFSQQVQDLRQELAEMRELLGKEPSPGREDAPEHERG